MRKSCIYFVSWISARTVHSFGWNVPSAEAAQGLDARMLLKRGQEAQIFAEASSCLPRVRAAKFY